MPFDSARLRHPVPFPAALALVAALLSGCATVPGEPGQPLPAATPAPAPAIAPGPVTPVATAAELQTLRTLVAAQDRLYRIAGPLLVNNADLCRNHARNLLGFRAKNRHSYTHELANAAQQALGLDERLRVTGVLPGSGAARAGIRNGDVLAGVDGKAFTAGEHAEREAAALLGPLVAERNMLKLRVLRDGSDLTLDVPLTRACAFNIEVGNTDLVNAYGDGFRVLVTRGMLNAVRDDDELAAVLAKEMAHNVLGHAARQNQNATMGGIIDNLVRVQPDMSTMAGLSGLRPVAVDFDAAADRLSIYLLARAGYNIERTAAFWRRMAAQYPSAQQNNHTALHPNIERRASAIEQAVRDVRARRAAGRPLVPAP